VSDAADSGARPAGTIHDLGYKRYIGTRRAPSTRWRVIARHQLAISWKTWWRFKSALGLAVITTFIAGGFLYFWKNTLSRLLERGGVQLKLGDAVIPQSIEWYCRVGFVSSLLIGAGIVAGDVSSGAFTFYFARSVRPRDYVLGKLAGLGMLTAAIVFAGPLLLAALRLGLSDSTDELVENLHIVPKTLAVAGLATLVYTVVPLGFSALVANRRYALAMWAAYYLVVGFMAVLLGFISTGAVAALDLPTAIQSVARSMFDVDFRFGRRIDVPPAAALVSIFAHVTAAIAIVWWSVSRAQKTGVGGAS
jgi:ABC-type transport system involved in multi-copper enzyme maturation permease subunit